MKPVDIRIVEDKELLVCWDTGERSLYASVFLQLACKCARCVDEITGEKKIQENQIDPDVKILEVIPIGNYAIRFKWTSGCTSGIYSFDYLYSIRPQRT